MVSKLKKIIPLEWKIKAYLFGYQLKKTENFPFKFLNKTHKRVFIFLAADYGNLGDVAITYAQHKFLKENLPSYLVTEIPISKTIEGIAFVKKIVSKDDIITTVGGGNMGDLYPMIESFRQNIISNFKNNKIISFPQTIDFSETVKGQKALKKAIKIYSKHPNLTLVAREHKSYDYYKIYFPENNILLTPDIVLSQNQSLYQFKRKGAIICLRDDKEKKLTIEQEGKLVGLLKNEFNAIKFRDTHIGGERLSLKNRVSQLKLIWEDFKKAELVVTDRLHGMIFCYITGTPVIVFLNNNHKVKSSYHWINSAQHVKLIEEFSIENIQTAIKELKNNDKETKLENMLHYYDTILKTIDS
ncbi:polysaccharide pyruvyl transferase family protein [Thalassobellus suaedae]|uniref:Polysaccharide pyruvyl transferase family protein n=1 Tax=Thalassobellus suaedae TaxID=3074124 RepID=A0ABY9Y1Z8_9FLAO|nr:polysaccharide pyruvyl transferase family protein [Flavobacteriaceae bacterium HL-DH10]